MDEELIAREYTRAEQATSFLEPKLRNLHDPHLLPSVPQAASRTGEAVKSKCRITTDGDYGVDEAPLRDFGIY